MKEAIQDDIADIRDIKSPYEWEQVSNPDGTVTWQLVMETPPPAQIYPEISPTATAAATAPSAPLYGE